jgi:lipopolysaccharide heptosyltransferase II
MFDEIKRIMRTSKGSPRNRPIAAFLHVALWPILLIPRLFWPRRRSKTLPACPKILLIRIDGIGDLAMSSGSVSALRKKFPDAQIDLLTSDAAKPVGQMLAAAGWINNIYTLPVLDRRIADYRWMARRLRGQKYDVGIDLRGDLRNVLLIWMVGAPIRLGHRGSGLAYLLTEAIDLAVPHHQAEEPIALVKRLGVEQVDHAPRLPVPAEDIAAADRWLNEHGVQADRLLCAMHLSAFQPSKIWPLDRFVATARRLQNENNAQILIIGGKTDADLSREFVVQFAQPVLMAVGELPLTVTAAALARCSVLIGNDSGPAHIAAVVGCPVVVIFGHGNPAAFGPRSSRAILLRSPIPCDPLCDNFCARPATCSLLDVSVDLVVASARSLINSKHAGELQGSAQPLDRIAPIAPFLQQGD